MGWAVVAELATLQEHPPYARMPVLVAQVL
jgi:hypothetical protein